MADPFSAAGTAVGIVSLGLQVCQGAFQYYAKFRTYHNDIEAVVQRTEALLHLLKTLESSRKKKIEIGSDEPSEQLLLAVQACYTGLQKLELITKKFSQTKLPDGIHEISRHVRRRLLWPFRKDTLLDLQTMLNTLQDNLHLALQIMDVHVAAQHFNILSEASESIIQNTNDINHQLSGQAQMLHLMNSQIQALASRANHYDLLMSSHLATQDQKMDMIRSIVNHQPTLHSGGVSLMQRSAAQSTPMNSRKRYQHAALPHSKSLSSFVCRCPRPKSKIRKIMTSGFALFWTHEPIQLPGCAFYVHRKTKNTLGTTFTVPGRGINYFVQMAWTWGAGPLSYHMNCWNIVPPSSPAFLILSELQYYFLTFHPSQANDEDYITKPLALTLQCLSRLFGMNRAGASDILYDGSTLLHKAMEAIGSGLSLQHMRITQNCVSEINIFLHALDAFGVPRNERNRSGRAPLDSLFQNTYGTPSKTRLLEIPGLVGLDWSWSENLTRIRFWPDELYRRWSLLESSEYVYMEDPLYLSILQRDFDSFTRYLSDTPISQVSKNKPLLLVAVLRWPKGVETLLSRKIDTNILDASGHSALDHAIYLENLDVIHMLLRSDIRPTKYTWQLSLGAHWGGEQEIRRAFLVRLSRWFRHHATLDPGVFFLCSWSYVPQHSGILRLDVAWAKTRPVEYTLYHEDELDHLGASALFEAGFQDIDVLTTDDNYQAGTPLWMHSLSMWSLGAKKTLPLLAWLISKGADLHTEHRHLTTPVHAIFERIVVLQLGALIQNHVTTFGENSILGADTLSHEAADGCDLEEHSQADSEENEEKNVSRAGLSELIYSPDGYNDIERVEHENDQSKSGDDYFSGEDDIHQDGNEAEPGFENDHRSIGVIRHTFQVLVQQLWQNRKTDSCNCACSSGGCSLLTVALKITRQAFDPATSSWRPFTESEWFEDTGRKSVVLDMISILLEYVPYSIWKDVECCREILRVLTFDRLGLTHTCHNLGHEKYTCLPRDPLDQDEIKDIHYSEEKDLDLLENLLNEFEQHWLEDPEGFEKFLSGHWADRMNEVVANRSTPSEDEPESVFRETGVILELDGSERKQGVTFEMGTFEWFEAAVQKIMSGGEFESS